ncbi:50S ribosomal protein L32e [Methanotrichaceae archaeon M04Ac]|uniref:Large ribosomal subunit protein eL32 n=1 Tax=Candidatus Methanocrinis alkalitolerans TaxID=3033395 RepID=A0ABT5XBN2_9EURY|nr:50S ribosomal protein L32e [Methanothrix sp.]MDF0592114.1 50S ribosomal protein L32e [Candidatus Methanocrinis alkalitolerans]
MTSDTERLMKVRARQKKRKPEFNRCDSHKKKKLSPSWRRPRGLHNKLRRQISAKGKLVRVGYRSPKAVRGYHPCGMKEVLVKNAGDLLGAEGCAVRIAGTVGMKKRDEIEAMAREMNLKVLNPTSGGD